MGMPTPPPPIIGEHCGLCDDILWPAADTPKFIHLTASLMVRCPPLGRPPPNGIIILQQVFPNPCFWQYDSDAYFWEVSCAADGYVWCFDNAHNGGEHAFWGNLFGCVSHSDNLIVDCGDGDACHSGEVDIIWS